MLTVYSDLVRTQLQLIKKCHLVLDDVVFVINKLLTKVKYFTV